MADSKTVENKDHAKATDNTKQGETGDHNQKLQADGQSQAKPESRTPNTADANLPKVDVTDKSATAPEAKGATPEHHMSNDEMVKMWDKAVADNNGKPLSAVKGYYEAGVRKVDPAEHPNGLIFSSTESPMTMKNDVTVKYADGTRETFKAGTTLPNGYQISPKAVSSNGETRTISAASKLISTSGDGSVLKTGEIVGKAVVEKGQIGKLWGYVVSRPSTDLETGKPRIDTYPNNDLSRWSAVPGKEGIYSPNLETARPTEVIQVPKGYKGTFDVVYGGTAPLRPGDLIAKEEKTLPDGTKQTGFRRISEMDAVETYLGADASTKQALKESEARIRETYPNAVVKPAAHTADEYHAASAKAAEAGKDVAKTAGAAEGGKDVAKVSGAAEAGKDVSKVAEAAEAGKAAVKAATAVEEAAILGRLAKKLPLVGWVAAPIVAGTAALLTGATKAEAATAAAETYVPADAAGKGRWAEAAVELPEKVASVVPIIGEPLAKVITDPIRDALRARGYDVDPSTPEQYRNRLKSEYSWAEVRDGLQTPGSPIRTKYEAELGTAYDELAKKSAESGGRIHIPTRDNWIRAQVNVALTPLVTYDRTLATLVPSGIHRS